jgi:hypothetical protein
VYGVLKERVARAVQVKLMLLNTQLHGRVETTRQGRGSWHKVAQGVAGETAGIQDNILYFQ